MPDRNSKRTRVEPVFEWLTSQGDPAWPTTLLGLCKGLEATIDPGPIRSVEYAVERTVPASPARLAWMLRNWRLLAPSDGSKYREFEARLSDAAAVDAAIQKLEAGDRFVAQAYVLEGASHADCLIECENAVIWIEGKRDDWLSTSISWDVTRDQLARNLEAAWQIAAENEREYCVVIAYEDELKHHEQALIDGYRSGSWSAGWPHLPEAQRKEFGRRIGTVRWREIIGAWPGMATSPAATPRAPRHTRPRTPPPAPARPAAPPRAL